MRAEEGRKRLEVSRGKNEVAYRSGGGGGGRGSLLSDPVICVTSREGKNKEQVRR